MNYFVFFGNFSAKTIHKIWQLFILQEKSWSSM